MINAICDLDIILPCKITNDLPECQYFAYKICNL